MTALALRLNLQELSLSLIDLHRSLLRTQQRRHEQAHGAVAPARLLDLALLDPEFSWLRGFSGLIVAVDERLSDDAPIAVSEATAFRSRTERQLATDEAGLAERLRTAVQESPEVAIGLGRLRMALADLPPPRAIA